MDEPTPAGGSSAQGTAAPTRFRPLLTRPRVIVLVLIVVTGALVAVQLAGFLSAGQGAAVAGAHFGLGLPLPFGWCFLVIAASSWLNLTLRIRYPASHRLSDDAAVLLLAFDIIQLAALLFLTGGAPLGARRRGVVGLGLVLPAVGSSGATCATCDGARA